MLHSLSQNNAAVELALSKIPAPAGVPKFLVMFRLSLCQGTGTKPMRDVILVKQGLKPGAEINQFGVATPRGHSRWL